MRCFRRKNKGSPPAAVTFSRMARDVHLRLASWLNSWNSPPMQRVANPPKLPVIYATATKPRGGLRSGKTCVWAMVVAVLSGYDVDRSLVLAEEVPLGGVPRPAAASAERGNVVVVGASVPRAAIIRDHAEAVRRESFSRLLGEADPAPWLVRCEIHVHVSPDSFAQAVGGPPGDARGATSLEFSGDRVITRRIDVMGDGPMIIPDAIDHELVHVVLADHFVHAAPPRWADEGLALLYDSPEKQRGHEADFQEARSRGLAWTAAELLAMEDYPTDAARQRVFYGQSAALVRWLIARKDAATFIRFLDDAAAQGVDAALDRHYALSSAEGSVDSVSSAWKEVAPINSLGLSEVRR